jgi:signal peptidase I
MAGSLRERLKGPWRVAVTEGSMVPAIAPGDWLVVSPLPSRWPAVGSVVVFREPLGETLAIKRVAARGGDRVPYAGGFLVLDDDEAWLLSDADEKAAAAVGSGPPVDSQRYGPVGAASLVGRVLFRYWPLRRIGRVARGQRRAGTPA